MRLYRKFWRNKCSKMWRSSCLKLRPEMRYENFFQQFATLVAWMPNIWSTLCLSLMMRTLLNRRRKFISERSWCLSVITSMVVNVGNWILCSSAREAYEAWKKMCTNCREQHFNEHSFFGFITRRISESGKSRIMCSTDDDWGRHKSQHVNILTACASNHFWPFPPNANDDK